MDKKEKTKGYIFLTLWAILIILGIIEKRIYGNPDLMVFFHLPAAVFLVLAGYTLSRKIRLKYKSEVQRRFSQNSL